MDAKCLSLYLVTDRYDYDQAKFLEIIEDSLKSGVTIVQLREKELSTKAYYELALAVKKLTDSYQVPLIIDDRLDICLAVDAAGLHIGDEELPVAVTRQLLGTDKILGVSAKSVARAQAAASQGADYLGVGAIYPTKTKVVTQLTSLTTLKEITQAVTLPVVAIGGITEERIADFAGLEIAGICMVSEIMQAQNVRQKVQQIKAQVNEVLKKGVRV